MTSSDRDRLAGLVAVIDPCDELEGQHQRQVLDWIASPAPLYRISKPDVPDMHLVTYFVVTDPEAEQMLMIDHINAGLRLPTGGHCDPGEMPWQTVERECREELGIAAVPTPWLGTAPLFVTVTPTRDPLGTLGSHTDVTLWLVLLSDPHHVMAFDRREFAAAHWMPAHQILATPIEQLDPHMHRFTRKYLTARNAHTASVLRT